MTKEAAKQELAGMYRVDDPTAHKVQIGKFILLRQDDSSVWLQVEDAEGMQIDDVAFELWLDGLFAKEF
jgi:hypothetical protein